MHEEERGREELMLERRRRGFERGKKKAKKIRKEREREGEKGGEVDEGGDERTV